jgi:hypothetical protein
LAAGAFFAAGAAFLAAGAAFFAAGAAALAGAAFFAAGAAFFAGAFFAVAMVGFPSRSGMFSGHQTRSTTGVPDANGVSPAFQAGARHFSRVFRGKAVADGPENNNPK